MTGLHEWFQTPPGRYLLEWERARFDAALADVFGYHALQLGLPSIDALAANRMPHRWLALTAPPPAAADAPAAPDSPARPKNQETAPAAPEPECVAETPPGRRAALVADSTALPFAEASLDLVALPHTLELSSDPHATLREVQRVLVYEGRAVIAGLNPTSLWGLRQWRARQWRRFGWERLFLPGDAGSFIGHWRLRDWLRLLEFDLQSISFGCYRPALLGEGALARFGWMDRLGARWWPIFGAAYFVVAVKRAQGARLVGPAWKAAPAVVGSPASVAHRAAPPAASQNEPR